MTQAVGRVPLFVKAQLERIYGAPLTEQQALALLAQAQADQQEQVRGPDAGPSRVGSALGRAGKAAGNFLTREDGAGFRVLEALGNIGGSIATGRAISDANKQDARSNASANLINALSSRAVARPTRTQPTLGLMGQLSQGIAGVGRSGLQHQQQRRAMEQQDTENQLAGRRVAAQEQSAAASMMSALARQGGTVAAPKPLPAEKLAELRRLHPGGEGLSKENFTTNDWSIIVGKAEDEEVDRLPLANLEELRRLHPAGEALDPADYHPDDWRIITGEAEPEEPDELEPDKLRAFVDAMLTEAQEGETLQDVLARTPERLTRFNAFSEQEQGYIADRFTAPTPTADRVPSSGGGDSITTTGVMNLAEAELFRVQVEQITDLFSRTKLRGGIRDRFLQWIGATGMPTIPEVTGEPMRLDVEDRVFQSIYPEDSLFRQRLATFSVLYAAAINQGRPTEPDRELAALSLPIIGESEEVQVAKLRMMSEIAVVAELLLRKNMKVNLAGFIDLTNNELRRSALARQVAASFDDQTAREIAKRLRLHDQEEAKPGSREEIDTEGMRIERNGG